MWCLLQITLIPIEQFVRLFSMLTDVTLVYHIDVYCIGEKIKYLQIIVLQQIHMIKREYFKCSPLVRYFKFIDLMLAKHAVFR